MRGEAHRLALAELLKETRAARMADRLPEESRKRRGLLISIGMDDPEVGKTEGEAKTDELEDEIDEETD